MAHRRAASLVAGQHVGDEIARAARIEARAAAQRTVRRPLPKRRHGTIDAAARERRVGIDQFQQRHLDVSNGHAQPKRRVRRAEMRKAQTAEIRAECLDPHAIQELHERDVEREHERIPHRHRATMGRVEVGRTIALERHRHIVQPLAQRGEAAVQRERRQKRLERRAGRTRRQGRVDLPRLRIKVVAAARERDDASRLDLQHHRRHGIAALLGGRVNRVRDSRLNVRVQRRDEIAAPPRGLALTPQMPQDPIAEVRMPERTGRAADDGHDALRAFQLLAGDQAPRAHPAQHVVPPPKRRRKPPIGTEARRGLHHAGQQRRFAKAQFLGRLAEPPDGRRLDADEVRPERRAVEILRENPPLVPRPLQLERHHGLAKLPQVRLRMRTNQPHGLHRDRRGPGDAPSPEDVLDERPQNRERTHAGMRPERAVFRRDHRLDDPVLRIGDIGRPAVHVVRAERHAQDAPGGIAQDDPAGIRDRVAVRRVKDEPRDGQEQGERGAEDDTSPPQTRPEA